MRSALDHATKAGPIGGRITSYERQRAFRHLRRVLAARRHRVDALRAHAPGRCSEERLHAPSIERQLAATRDLLLPRLVTGRLDISDVDLGVLDPTEVE